MYVSAHMQWLREELDTLGVEYVTDDSDDSFIEDTGVHCERTFFGNAEVSYVWMWDDCDRKIGISEGWPAYLEMRLDGDVKIVSVDEVLDFVREALSFRWVNSFHEDPQ